MCSAQTLGVKYILARKMKQVLRNKIKQHIKLFKYENETSKKKVFDEKSHVCVNSSKKKTKKKTNLKKIFRAGKE